MLDALLSLRGFLFIAVTAAVILLTFSRPHVGTIYLVVLNFFGVILNNEIWSLFSFLHIPFLMGALTLFSWFINRGLSTENKVPYSFEMLFLFCFFIVATLSSLSAGGGFLGNDIVDRLAKSFVVFFLIVVTINTRERQRQFLWAVIIVNVVLAYIAYDNYRNEGYEYALPRPHLIGGLAPGGFAATLVMTLPIAYVLLWREKGTYKKVFLGIAIPLLILCTIKTFSRTGSLSLLLAGAFLLFADMGNRRRMALIIPVLLIGLSLHPNFVFSRIEPMLTYEEDSSSMLRVYQWEAALNAVAENPLLGVGPGNFSAIYTDYLPYDVGQNLPEEKSIHGAFSQVISETGVTGFFFYSALLLATVFSVVRVRRACKGVKGKEEVRELTTALGISFLCYIFYSIANPAAYNATLYLLIGAVASAKSIALKKDQIK